MLVEVHLDSIFPDSGLRAVGQESASNITPFDTLLKRYLINYDQARPWRTEQFGGQIALPGFLLRSNDDLEPRYKVVVDQDGMYKISYNALQAAGMDVGQVDPALIHLTNQGRDVALEFHDNGGNNSYFIFYGQKFNGDYLASIYSSEDANWNTYLQQQPDGAYIAWHPEFNALMIEKYTDENVYWLTVESGPGLRMPPEVNGDPTGSTASTPDHYTEVVRSEPHERWWSTHFLTEDTWFSERLTHSGVYTYTANLSALASSIYTATVRGQFASFNSNDSTSPDHHTRVVLNDINWPVDEGLWDGRSMYTFENVVPQAVLHNGINELRFIALYDTVNYPTLVSPFYYFDWFEIAYQRVFDAINNSLQFPVELPGNWKYVIGGFSDPEITIYDITSPLSPVRIANPIVNTINNQSTATFVLSAIQEAQIIAVSETGIRSPKSITAYTPPDLKSPSNGADYIVISHPDLIPYLQPLLDYRASRGLRVKLVNLEDIYNEFNEGIRHPIAIKNFIKYTFTSWQPPAPTYVLLVGDGTFNMQGYNPTRYGADLNLIPPYLAWVDPWQGEVDATNLLATVVGDDPMPDLAIGRLLVNNADELNRVISKTISYEQAETHDWQRNLLFVADNPDSAGEFEASAETVIAGYVPSSYTVDKIFLADYTRQGTCGTPIPGGPVCPAVNQVIRDSLSITGTVLVDYNGHGSVRGWAGEQIWTNDDIPSLNNAAKLPVILSMTCLDGFWFGPTYNGNEAPYGPSLSEEMVRADGKGAVAAFSPGGLGVATGHDNLQQGFYASVFLDRVDDLGIASLAAKLNLYNSGYNFDLLNTFTIIGDPALRLQIVVPVVYLPIVH
jgi:hypothetical protein